MDAKAEPSHEDPHAAVAATPPSDDARASEGATPPSDDARAADTKERESAEPTTSAKVSRVASQHADAHDAPSWHDDMRDAEPSHGDAADEAVFGEGTASRDPQTSAVRTPARQVSHATPASKPAVGIPLVMPFAPGDVIADKYEIIKVIGSGGMGYVVSATHIELGHQVALKFLRPELLVHHDLVARFAKEARTAVMIKSEHVARVFDVGTLPEAGPFIAMELLEGKDLGRVVADRGPLSVEAAVDYILQACEALATAHSLGIVHRDIKPENLFLSRSIPGVDVIKVLDFGISKLSVPEPQSPHRSPRPMVISTSAVGSPTYMSPEQIRASDDVDARADVWALGCVLYELLSGTAAFDAPSVTELSAKILERPPAPLRSINPDLPPDLEWVIGHCLGKDPAKRFQNVGELAVALCPFASPRSRIVADRCRYVLDPAAALEELDETTGPVSWNGVSTGLERSTLRPPSPSSSVSAMQRVTVAARRVVREKRPFAPVVAVAVLGLTAGVWRAVSSDAGPAVTASQTFLAAPGPGLAPAANDLLGLASPAAAPREGAPTDETEAMAHLPEATSTAFAEREPEAPLRAAARRPAPAPVRPKPAANSTANEPDVGF